MRLRAKLWKEGLTRGQVDSLERRKQKVTNSNAKITGSTIFDTRHTYEHEFRTVANNGFFVRILGTERIHHLIYVPFVAEMSSPAPRSVRIWLFR
jgi:hypothetical protein